MRIEVAGIPAPQGSKRHVGGGRMVEVSRAVGPWREAVRAETQRAMIARIVDDPNQPGYKMGIQLMPFDGPVDVRIIFRLPRPKSAPKSVRWPAKRPDLDKLCRAVLDGLTAGGAFADDGQVVRLYSVKQFAGAGDRFGSGCRIFIQEAK